MAKYSIDELARQVMAGKWGKGAERKKRLTEAGYDYDAVQSRVNEKYYGITTTTAPKAAAPQAPKAATPNKTPSEMTNPNQPTYQQSDTVKQAAQDLADWQKNKPGDYASPYSQQIEQLYNQIVGRPDFSYDFNADPIYQQYKDQYTRLGNLAMRDTMGQAAALTGGYGSSYATTAGQQAYDAHLQQLNNVIPELYDAAYNRYRGEGDDMLTQLQLLQQQDEIAYGRHRDAVGDYYNFLDYYNNKYQYEREFDYGQFIDEWNQWDTNRKFDYGKEQDALNQANWQKEFAEKQRHNAAIEAAARLEAENAAKKGGIVGKDLYEFIDGVASKTNELGETINDDEDIANAVWLAYGEYPDQLLAMTENYRLPSGKYLADVLVDMLGGKI